MMGKVVMEASGNGPPLFSTRSMGSYPQDYIPGTVLLFRFKADFTDLFCAQRYSVDFFDGIHRVVASILRDGTLFCPDVDSVCSRWAVHTQQFLESLKGDLSETGTSATIHIHGLAVVLCMTFPVEC